MYCLTAGFASLKRDQLQFSYKANKATADTITTVLHAALSHTDKQGSYVRILCVNFSLAFSTILLNILTKKLTDGFLTDHPQAVRVGPSTHSTLRTGLYTQNRLYTESLPVHAVCTWLRPHHHSNISGGSHLQPWGDSVQGWGPVTGHVVSGQVITSWEGSGIVTRRQIWLERSTVSQWRAC